MIKKKLHTVFIGINENEWKNMDDFKMNVFINISQVFVTQDYGKKTP